MKTYRVSKSLSTLLALPVLVTQLAHADYQSTVLGHNPKAYYRFNDDTSRSLINVNSGSLGAAGNATNDLSDFGVVHPFPGALAGDGNRAVFFDTSTRTEIPFNSALNPPNTQPFTVEAWLYPSSDQSVGGMSPLANRYTQGADRQGWVVFQRKPNANYSEGEPVGWNFRMFKGVGGSTGLDVTSLVPFEVGKWQHVAVVYDPVQVTNATLTIYINGVAANTNIWNGGTGGIEPGYAPCTGDHDPGEAVNGQPALALGNYNNANSSLNPWFGAADEFAFYSAKLTPAQILSHYQNGTNAARTVPYKTLILSHNPVAYLRLDDIAPSADTAINMGDLRNVGLATHTAEVVHPGVSALAGRTDDGSASYHNRNGNATTTLPWSLENNPNAGVPFTFETWLRPMRDQQGGQCPVNNRVAVSGFSRTGWVIFQRNPNLTYPASEGHGWNFRMFSGTGTGGHDVLTGADYVVGKWQHLVVTWEPQIPNGDVGGNGNDQWQGILTAYVDGVAVATNPTALYSANREFPEDGGAPADLGIGAYNAKSGLGNNPYEGDIDELAIYNNYLLTPDQILAHYQAGTNANYGTNYETLVLTAPFPGPGGVPGPQRQGPKTYLRFNDPAYFPAANSGTIGYLADGSQIVTSNVLAGPQPPTYAGFEASNTALPLDGLKQSANLNNPADLNLAGQITLEAWVKPDAFQGDPARIISHGPQTPSNFLGAGLDNAVTNTSEVFLAIEGGANYVVGSREVIDGVTINTYSASFPIPGGDLGGTDWIHLAGTYDGANWRLYRNGLEVASAAAAVGALPVSDGNWAIGSTGNGWANNYAGGADEVAIYSTALTANQIASHYVAGKAGTAALTIIPTGGGNVTITWPAGTTLQQSSLVTGTYTNTPGSPVSPLTIPATGTKFYRWTLP
jgi:hypothetical protein